MEKGPSPESGNAVAEGENDLSEYKWSMKFLQNTYWNNRE